jgi:hypothetical protein
MLVDTGNAVGGSTVAGAIRQASQATGTSFQYLLATAQVESGLNPQAGASTSSARGLFQFIQQTWLATLKQAGPALGYGRYAAAITESAAGQYEVRDPSLRNEVLALRNDPTANAVMAGAFTKANAAALAERLGRSPSEAELYIAHFLGAGGAARLIDLAASNPNAQAADFFSDAAQANSSIFYDQSTGAARSVAQVRNILTARYDVARGSQSQSAVAQAAAGLAAAAPATAGVAHAFAAATPTRKAGDNQIFHGLFVDANLVASIAPAASALWGTSSSTPLTGGSAAPTSSASDTLLDLFKDPAKGS